jgi:hypothetical protein
MYELLPDRAGRELIPGDPDALDELARRLGGFAAGLGEAAGRLRAIHTGGWKGPAGQAFEALINDQPAKFDRAATSFGAAQRTISGYAATLRQAQADATRASSLLAAELATAPDAARDAAAGGPSSAAQVLFADACGRVDLAAAGARTTLYAAAGDAPHKPGFLHRAASAVGHAFSAAFHGFADRVEQGAHELDSLTFALFYDPGRFERSWCALGYGLVYDDPVSFLKDMLDLKDWGSNPGRALGETLANVLCPIGGMVLATENAPGAPPVERVPKEPQAGPLQLDRDIRHVPVPAAALAHSADDPLTVDGAQVYRGLSESATYSQRTYSTAFSAQGRFSGDDVDDVARKLRLGVLSPLDIPVTVVVLDGHTLIDNTRSASALTRAGIPRAEWVVRDVTASGAARKAIAKRLKANSLSTAGIASVVVGPSPRSPEWKKRFPGLPGGFRWPALPLPGRASPPPRGPSRPGARPVRQPSAPARPVRNARRAHVPA